MTRSASDALRRYAEQAWPVLLCLAIAYVSLSTRDLNVGVVPLKFVITALALASWALARMPSRLPWQLPLAAFGLVVPGAWLLVAAVRHVSNDPAQAQGLENAAVEASRFTYVLLAWPLMDWMRSRRHDQNADRIWLWPVVALAAGTCLIYILYLGGVHYAPTGNLGPFQGDFGVDVETGWFRAFMITDVLFVPAVVALFARIQAGYRNRVDLAQMAVVLAGVVLAHSRGIWTGVTVACGVCLLAGVLPRLAYPKVAISVAVAVFVGPLILMAVPTLLRSATTAVSGGSAEQSVGVRLEQTPRLLDGVTRHRLLGSGLGAVLPSGYRRSESVPWSFELAYLQLLFQTGALGLALIAWLPIRVLWDGTRGMLMTYRETKVESATLMAGIGGVAGLLFACANNPYLLTSPGTLALGIATALAAQPLTAADRESPFAPGGPH